jgi:hypothetical protein
MTTEKQAPKKLISKEVATQEIEAWLDAKRVRQSEREEKQARIDFLTEVIQEGLLVRKEDNTLVYTLLFPIGTELKTSELNFKPRLTIGVVNNYLSGLKATDGDNRMIAYARAVTSAPAETIKALDMEDYAVVSAIVGFFL